MNMSNNNLDEYYVFKDDYYRLKELAEKLRTPDISSDELIKFMKSHKIDVNAYLTTFHVKPELAIYVPIYWQVVSTPVHSKFFRWLINNGADITKLPDCADNSKLQHVLFACHESYIKELLISIQHPSYVIPNLSNQIKNKILSGNIRRILILLKVKAITKKDINDVLNKSPDLYFEVLNVLIDRIHLICRTHNSKNEVQQVINKYIKVFEFIMKFKDIPMNLIYQNNNNGNISIYEYLANFYLYEFIDLFKSNNIQIKTNLKVTYHVDMNVKLVASIRQLLNDNRYVRTCQSLDQPIDARAY